MRSRGQAPGEPNGESGCARPILTRSWRCTPARVPARRQRSASPPSLPLCSGSWKSAPMRQRTCSAFQGQKPSSPLCIVTAHSTVLACACRAGRPRAGSFSARRAAWHRILAASPKRLSSASQGRRVQFALKEASSVPSEALGKRKPGG